MDEVVVPELGLAIPAGEYVALQNQGRPSERAAREILAGLDRARARRVVLFGRGSTARALGELLGERVCGTAETGDLGQIGTSGCDAVVLATAPVHYATAVATIASAFASPPLIVRLFSESSPIDVRLILETQPRSGTHYTLDNLMRCLGWGYADVFPHAGDPTFQAAPDGRFFYVPRPGVSGYVVKAHFTRPLHYPEYRYVPVIFQVAYPFDSYYSWAKTLLPGEPPPGYRLEAGSREWGILQGHLAENVRWLDYVAGGCTIRYEAYYQDLGEVLRRIAARIGRPALEGFEPPRKNPARMYWSGTAAPFLDRAVFDALAGAFGSALRRFWPETVASLTYR